MLHIAHFMRTQYVTLSLLPYLSDHEVHVLLHEDVQLFLEDGLHLGLTLAAQVGGGLGDSARHQGISLIGHLSGEVTGSFVHLGAL